MKIIEPKKVGEKYVWSELEVRKSGEPGGGNGVFARVALSAGTMIPILGIRIKPAKVAILKKQNKATHISEYRGLIINGDPEINKTGLNIALLVNEPSKTKPNCVFKLGFLVVAQSIKPGGELTVFYGNDYGRVGYSLAGNRHLDGEYPAMDRIQTWATADERAAIINKWLTISEGGKKPAKPAKEISATPVAVLKQIQSELTLGNPSQHP